MAKSFDKKPRKPLLKTGDFLDVASEGKNKETSDNKSGSNKTEKKTKKVKPEKPKRSHYTAKILDSTQADIKDIVYTKRSSGQFKFTQASAIEMAVAMLKESMGKIEKDPER